MRGSLSAYAALAHALKKMESDLGLDELSHTEKMIVSSISALEEQVVAIGSGYISSKTIHEHYLCAAIPDPSFFRALRALTDRGLLVLPKNRKKGLYQLSATI